MKPRIRKSRSTGVWMVVSMTDFRTFRTWRAALNHALTGQ